MIYVSTERRIGGEKKREKGREREKEKLFPLS
jgi:hypothetical protein